MLLMREVTFGNPPVRRAAPGAGHRANVLTKRLNSLVDAACWSATSTRDKPWFEYHLTKIAAELVRRG